MKNTFKKITLAFVAFTFTATMAFANHHDGNSSKDWKLLASKADYVIRKGADMPSAKKWIEESLEIKEDTYNLEIMGDYYMKNKMYKEATMYYLKSIDALKEKSGDMIDTSHLQKKIIKAQRK